MSDFGQFGGGADEENAETRALRSEVDADPDNFEKWEKLIRAVEMDGSLNRNSSPQSIAAFRHSYDSFLEKFPLFFAYWKKYADQEFNIAGPESAEMIYERGCASITHSVDLWTDYCSFKMETTHIPALVRELFERGASCVGLDFLAHPFWDKYLEYEERQEAQDRILAILQRIVNIPMHQYSRYYERLRAMISTRPLSELAPSPTITRFRSDIMAESATYGGPPRPDDEIDAAIRAKVDAMYYENFIRVQGETNRRWPFESEIKRPYFHVTELEHQQLNNWRKYLDFEEAEGDYTRILFLYERCLVTCALYDEFWFRYARWMSAQKNKTEEVRSIYIRASTMFVPVSRPGIRLQFAYFEESCGRVDIANDIHAALLMTLPDCIEVIVSWAHLQRRQSGLDAAIGIYKAQIDNPQMDIYTKAALVTEWAFLLWRVKGSVDEARAVFSKNVQWYADSRIFWEKWLEFELQQPTNAELEAEHGERIKSVVDQLRTKSRLSVLIKKELSRGYFTYLLQRGGKDAMAQFLAIDRETFGPPSVSVFSRSKAGAKENGLTTAELDETTKLRAEAKYWTFYDLHGDADSDASGQASFN